MARGDLGGVARAIEFGLAKLITLVIGLFARLIGLGGLADKVKKIFKKIRKRVDTAIKKLLKKAKAAGRKIMRKLGLGKDKPKNKEQHDQQVKAGMTYLHQQEKALDNDKDKAITQEEANKVASKTKSKFKVFTSITPKVEGGKWVYHWTGSSGKEKGAKTEGTEEGADSVPVVKSDLLKAKYKKGRFLADVIKIDNKKKEITHEFRYKKLSAGKQKNTFAKFNEKFKNGEIEKVNGERQHLIKNRPSYITGLVDKVWDNAKNPAGKVFDPHMRPRKELFWDKSKSRFAQWHMGHRTGEEYKDLVDKYINGDRTWEEFIDDYNNAANYYPEDPKSNMSHKFEKK